MNANIIKKLEEHYLFSPETVNTVDYSPATFADGTPLPAHMQMVRTYQVHVTPNHRDATPRIDASVTEYADGRIQVAWQTKTWHERVLE